MVASWCGAGGVLVPSTVGPVLGRERLPLGWFLNARSIRLFVVSRERRTVAQVTQG